ncbi:MAG: hypothetical protein ACRCWG_02990 [Sarcina sp.]
MALTQNERNKNWESKNKEYSNYLKSRSTAKSFINKKATKEDLTNLKELIEIKLSEFNYN